jgi:ribosomal protein S18 acetylase RimI-like enzyme
LCTRKRLAIKVDTISQGCKINMFEVRNSGLRDISKVLELYRAVSIVSGGIIRIAEEITPHYIEDFITKSLQSGLAFVVEHPNNKDEIIAEIHAYQYGLSAFRHILTDLTIVVHPAFQGQRVGKLIFEHLLGEVTEKMPHILRVELFVREANVKAIEFYKKLGFVEEGRHKNKIKNRDNSLETPIEMTWFNPSYKNEKQ